MPLPKRLLRLSLLSALTIAVGGPAYAQSRGSARKTTNKAKPASSVVKQHRTARPSQRNVAKPLRSTTRPAAVAKTRHLADGLNSIFAQKLDGISVPHPDVVKQIAEAAGGKLRGPVYVVRYGTEAAHQVTALTKENGMGLIYKGSAGNGHSMAWVGGKLTDSVPGRHSFGNGAKTRIHEFQPQSERPQIVAAFDLPKSIIGKATENATEMAQSKKQCGADCAGYVREIAVKTSTLAKDAGSSNGIAELAGKLQNYQAPTRLRNTSLGLADAVILMVSKHDWRNPESAGYSINDWNKK